MKTRYEKPTVLAVYESIADGAVCNPGSQATLPPVDCGPTGQSVNNPQLPTSCAQGGTARGADCGTGQWVFACNIGTSPTSTCNVGYGVTG